MYKYIHINIYINIGKLDSDPHLWMPMTLEKDSYLHLMDQKGFTAEVAGAHFDRISVMMKRFHEDDDTKGLEVFGPVDVGQGVYWWDYGQLKLYQQYALMMTQNTDESELMRMFFGVCSNDRCKGEEIIIIEFKMRLLIYSYLYLY
jgi:hypothetical protein